MKMKLGNEALMAKISSRWSDTVLAVISIVLIFMLALPLLPFILKANSSNVMSMNMSLVFDLKTNNSTLCLPQPYTGSMCLLELQMWHSDLPEKHNGSDVLIPSDVDQELREEQVQMLFTQLHLLRPTKECHRDFKSFWCLLLFKVCDNRTLPSHDVQQIDSCTELTQDRIVGEIHISLLHEYVDSFLTLNTTSFSGQSSRNVTCSDQFYFDQSSLICKPECGVWTTLSKRAAIAWEVFFFAGDAIAFVTCVGVLILAMINRKRISTFPTVLILYQTIMITVTSFLSIIHKALQNELLCTSPDLIENLHPHQSSISCQLKGALLLYSMLMVALLWLFHTATFFWGVMWPYHYSVTRDEGRIKYIHIFVLLVSCIMPTVSVVAVQFSGGYGLSITTGHLCGIMKSEDLFYGVLLPLDVIIIIVVTLLLITGWRIADIKNRCTKKKMMNKFRMRTSEIKIVILISYFSLMALYNLSTASKHLAGKDNYIRVISEHFMCEAHGEGAECSKDSFQHLQNDIFAHSVGHTCTSLLPCAFFIFLFDLKKLRKLCHRRRN